MASPYPKTTLPAPRGTPARWSHGRRRRSGDAPGVPRGQELRNVARPALRDRLLLLVEHDLLVHGPRDRRQHADRDREVGSEEVREELRRVHVGLVVDPERARRDETNVNAAKLLADLFAPDFPVPIGERKRTHTNTSHPS